MTATDGAAGLMFPAPPEWTALAVCGQTDPEEFFPEKGGTTALAKKICRSCPVTAQCLDYALTHNEQFGIWGGRSPAERGVLLEEIPLDNTADDTWFTNGDDFTYTTDLGEIA
jgi:WhiB family redox-sensing transcriptional regulator